MDFGLGLILSFTDHATAGINNAVNSLNQLSGAAQGALSSLNDTATLSALSAVAGQMGDSFTSLGGKIIGQFQNVLGHVQSTGAEFQSFGLTLDKLYGNAEEADAAMSKLLDFSVKSPFEVGEVKDMLIVLKSQGIDAFEQVTGAARGFQQENLSWIADLMAFKPDEPVARWKRALTNYIGSGQELVLQNMLDMGKITDILGHAMGETTEERMRDIIEIVESINLEGYAAEMQNTMTGMSSNVEDAMTKLYKAIGDAGVFEKLMSSFASLKGVLLSLTNEEINNLGVSIASGLNVLLEPVVKVTDAFNKLFHYLVDIAKTRPEIVKWGVTFAGIAGAVLLGIGIFLKAASALSGLSLLYMAFGRQFSSLVTLFKVGTVKLLGSLIPMTLALSTMYLVWKNDLFNIRSAVTSFVSGVVNAFKTARYAVGGSAQEMNRVLSTFDLQHSFFDGLSLSIMRIMVLGKALVEGWNDYTLSYDTWEKARDLGILPLIEAIFDLKWRVEHFLQGFGVGFDRVATRITEFFKGLAKNVNGTVFEGLFQGLTDFLQALSDNDPQAWTDFGEKVGEVAAKAMLLVPAFVIVKTVLGIAVGKVRTFIITLKAFGPLFTTLFKGVQLLGKGLGIVFKFLAGNPVVAIVLGIAAAFAILYANSEKFRTAVSETMTKLKEMGAEGALLSIPLFDRIKEALPQLIESFTNMGEAIFPVIENIGVLIMQLVPPIAELIGAVITTILDMLPSIMNIISVIADTITMVLEIVGQLIEVATPFITEIISMLSGLIADVLPVLADLISTVLDTVSNILSTVLPMIKSIAQALMPIIAAVLRIVSTIVSRLIPIIKSIVTIVSSVIKAILPVIQTIITVVVQIVNSIVNILSPIVTAILNGVGLIIDIVMGIVDVVVGIVDLVVSIVMGIVSTIIGIVTSIVTGIQAAISVLTGIVQVIVDTITGIISGVVGIVQGVWDGIVTVFSGAIQFFSDIFSSIFNVVTSTFDSIRNFFNDVWNGITTTFATLGDTISGIIRSAINNVIGGAVRIVNGFIRAINLAIGIINAIPGVEVRKLTELNVPMLAQGGVVEKPTAAIIGEAGAEAVMPLENNTEWIAVLADELGAKMFDNAQPPIRNGDNYSTTSTTNAYTTAGDVVNTYNTNTTNNSNANSVMNQRYITSSTTLNTNNQRFLTTNSTNNTRRENTFNNTKDYQYLTNSSEDNRETRIQDDHSVTFSPGSIVVQVMSASPEEAERLAKMVMEKIKQKQRVEKVMTYNQ